ncbi:uncharacterized protein [Acropora muricata]|uniref:uncharacterized protein n=1 Tax=Acropora muricata TaxID=159855 RepID=UPI0034E3F522
MLIQRVPTTDDLLNQKLQNWWRTDSFGTKYQLESPRTREDKRAIEILKSSVRHIGDRYEAGLLWKEKDVQLCDNRDVAEKRLKSTERSIKRDLALAERYSGIIKEYETEGYARKLTPAEAAMPSSKRWFLPHHPVLNPNKPGKVRMVMDAAAKKNGVSLNDNLLIGPDLLNSLTGVLMRFREQRVAIAADIGAMLHQVLVIEEDQPALSFLWRELDINRAPDVYQMSVLIFGAASSPSTANYVLHRTAEDNREDPAFSQEAINAVSKNFYMDDFLKSVNDVTTASLIQQEMTSFLACGGFRLTKWSSSSREVLSRIPSHELACPTLNLDLENLPMERTLGMKWNTESHCLCFSVRLGQSVLTKRGVQSRVSSVFDPLGVLSPYLFLAKSLIQTLWRKRKHVDEPLDPGDLVVWEKWSADLSSLQEFQLPRWTSIDKPSDALVQLHHFGDASEKGFGAVCYIRYTFPDGRIHVSFVIAKNRVAPLKQLSIPRLELQAALLAARLADTVKRELDLHISDTIFSSDSKTVLSYISNESRRFHTFVANIVSEIQDSSESSQWRYVPTHLNPADDCTRGLHASEITRKCRWITGPSFLRQTEDTWPKEIAPLLEDDIEVKKTVWTGLLEENGNSIPVPAKFSSWIRYRRVVAWILRFVQNTRLHRNERILTSLKVREIRQAEEVLIKRAQSESFPEDIEYLKSKKGLPSRSRLLPLRPFLSADRFLRVGGRLRKSPLPESARNPIILDPSHAVTSLIIAHYLQRLYCSEVEHVLNELRQKYWILKGLRAVMKVSSSCVLCRLRRSRPCPPVMANLPEARLGYEAPPFTHPSWR